MASSMKYVLYFLFISSFLVSALSISTQSQRKMLGSEVEEEKPKKKTNLLPSKNQTKLIKPITMKTSNSTKQTNNTTTKTSNSTISKALTKKLNSTTSKISNSTTKPTTIPIKKSSDLSKLNTPKNKTQSMNPNKQTQKTTEKTQKTTEKIQKSTEKRPIQKPKQQKPKKPITPDWMDTDVDEDFIAEFRDLPTKFHQTLIPDLEKFSLTSKAYVYKANREISEGFRPLVGKHYAPTIASVISCIFIFAPLLLVSLLFNKIKSYFSLQTILIFIQIYLSIYFFILSLASLLTGLEPLKFFYATSPSSYFCLQVLQTLGYVLFLLLLLMNLVLVFSTEGGIGSKMLGLGQTIVGCAVGLHYYLAVFHRAVLHQPPKTNWKVHGVYATCFLVICLFARAERRKKAYLEFGGEEGKKS